MTDSKSDLAKAKMKHDKQTATLSAATQMFSSLRGPNGLPLLSLKECLDLAGVAVACAYSDLMAQYIDDYEAKTGAYWNHIKKIEAAARERQREIHLQDLADEARVLDACTNNQETDNRE